MSKLVWPSGTKLVFIDNHDYDHIPLGTMVKLTADYYRGSEYAEVSWQTCITTSDGQRQKDGNYRADRFEKAQYQPVSDKAYYQAITEGIDKLSIDKLS